MAAAQNTVSIGAAAIQAVRVKLLDVDPAPVAKSIGVIHQGDESPPYTLTSDPMKIFSKFATFWLNYKQLAVIEYLEVFSAPEEERDSSLGLATWQKFTDINFVDADPRTLLCRVRPIGQGDISEESRLLIEKKDIFDLDFYNQYFILESAVN